MTRIETGYSGADWIKRSLAPEMSPLGELVADMLGVAFAGIYHVDTKRLRAVDWDNKHRIELRIGWTSFATYDDARLTMLVVLAHDAAVRLSIEPCNSRYLRLVFHPRNRVEGVRDLTGGHWTIEHAVEVIRKHYKVVADEPVAVEVPS